MAITQAVDAGDAASNLDRLRDAFINGTEYEEPSEAPKMAESPEPVSIEAPISAESSSTEPSQIEASIPGSEPEFETIWVKGANGTQQKVEVSYKDRAKIKEAYLKMAGMRKFQAERDEERKGKAELLKKIEELSYTTSELDRLYKEKGAKGLFERLGGAGAWERAVEEELGYREKIASMSPEERLNLSLQEREKVHAAEKNQLELKYREMQDKISKDQEAAATKALEAQLVPSFEKYRFAGKLGDAVAEQKIDKAIWGEVIEALESYDDITPSTIEKEFRAASAVYSKFVSKQVDSKLKDAVVKKKEHAAEKAQVAVKKGLASNNLESEVKSDIASSNWSSLLQKAFSGQVKF